MLRRKCRVYVVVLSETDITYNWRYHSLHIVKNINSLRDAIQSINADSHWFKKSSLFLFNKVDLFTQQIVNKAISECFDNNEMPEYDQKEYFNKETMNNEEIINKQFHHSIHIGLSEKNILIEF